MRHSTTEAGSSVRGLMTKKPHDGAHVTDEAAVANEAVSIASEDSKAGGRHAGCEAVERRV